MLKEKTLKRNENAITHGIKGIVKHSFHLTGLKNKEKKKQNNQIKLVTEDSKKGKCCLF